MGRAGTPRECLSLVLSRQMLTLGWAAHVEGPLHRRVVGCLSLFHMRASEGSGLHRVLAMPREGPSLHLC